jgi:hypothetical protein
MSIAAGKTIPTADTAIIRMDGMYAEVDESLPGFEYAERYGTGGPGTELSRLLKRFGIEPTPTCACRAKAAEMDALGCDECEKPERIAEVVAVMRAEAEARGLPFLDVAGRLLVKRAIRNARNA